MPGYFLEDEEDMAAEEIFNTLPGERQPVENMNLRAAKLSFELMSVCLSYLQSRNWRQNHWCYDWLSWTKDAGNDLNTSV